MIYVTIEKTNYYYEKINYYYLTNISIYLFTYLFIYFHMTSRFKLGTNIYNLVHKHVKIAKGILDISHVLSIHKNQHEAVLPNTLQNGSSSTREAAPPEKPEPELFLEESEPCQTDPKSNRLEIWGIWGVGYAMGWFPWAVDATHKGRPLWHADGLPVFHVQRF